MLSHKLFNLNGEDTECFRRIFLCKTFFPFFVAFKLNIIICRKNHFTCNYVDAYAQSDNMKDLNDLWNIYSWLNYFASPCIFRLCKINSCWNERMHLPRFSWMSQARNEFITCISQAKKSTYFSDTLLWPLYKRRNLIMWKRSSGPNLESIFVIICLYNFLLKQEMLDMH